MDANKYQKLAMTTLNPNLNKKEIIINGSMGLCGESGEVIDIVKKWLAQGHGLDKEKIIEELGDVCWYIAELSTVLGIDFEQLFDKNIEKLAKRYPNGFDKNNSINR